ncbi:MAG: leucine-rich repeat domain-containing protein [Clostridia bacterium]|nr:leucine-rich repeat domain-containing protein [Clostridia bacterium]
MGTGIKSKINKIYVVLTAIIVLICPFIFTGCTESEITEVRAENFNTVFYLGEEFDVGGDFKVYKKLDGDLIEVSRYDYDVDSSQYNKSVAGTYEIIVGVYGTNKTYSYEVTVKSVVLERVNHLTLGSLLPHEARVDDCEINVSSVDIPAYVKRINNVWYTGTDLEADYANSDSIYKVTGIFQRAFENCNLASVTIPNTVNKIEWHSFNNCVNLASITIPSSVRDIASEVFSGCTNLSSIVVDANNPTYDSRNNCNAIIRTTTNTLIAGCKNTVIPNTVRSIDTDAFNDCDGLESITIPSSVTRIGEYAFAYCSDLVSVTFEENSQLTTISNFAFYNSLSLSAITIPSSVTTIKPSAFAVCGLESIYIDSTTIASGITPNASFQYVTTIYINEEIVDGGASIGSYITSNFTRSATVVDGYYVYTKN